MPGTLRRRFGLRGPHLGKVGLRRPGKVHSSVWGARAADRGRCGGRFGLMRTPPWKGGASPPGKLHSSVWSAGSPWTLWWRFVLLAVNNCRSNGHTGCSPSAKMARAFRALAARAEPPLGPTWVTGGQFLQEQGLFRFSRFDQLHPQSDDQGWRRYALGQKRQQTAQGGGSVTDGHNAARQSSGG